MTKAPMPVASAHRLYVIQLTAWMLCYAVVLCVSLRLLHYTPNGWVRVPIALMPVVPIVFILVAVIQLFSRVDEMRRRIHVEAAAMAAAATVLLSATCGFLQNVGMPLLSGFWTFLVIDVFYISSVLLLNWRYR